MKKWTGIEKDKELLRMAYKPTNIGLLRSIECCVKVPNELPSVIAMTWDFKINKENT